jgi:hypothetical protein
MFYPQPTAVLWTTAQYAHTDLTTVSAAAAVPDLLPLP